MIKKSFGIVADLRQAAEPDPSREVVRAFEDEWRYGEPSLAEHWAVAGPSASHSVLVALVKVDLSSRYRRGERPAVQSYLDRFPELRADDDRVLSLIYEEFCLREESGDRPDAESFYERYEPWRESLASQLDYHHLLSQAAGAQSAPAPRFPQPGEDFEEFHLESLLGQGKTARVYLARDESLAGRKVALKVSPDRGQEPAILAKLDHKHIVPVHSVVFQIESKLRGLCMPYRPGLPLDQLIHRLDPEALPRHASALRDFVSFTPLHAESRTASEQGGWEGFPARGTYSEGVAWVVAMLARALAHAHAQGILHRDVKPANVLITARDGPQLLDFNLAHDPHSADQAEAALRGGTLPYMAPEQLEAFLDPECWDRVGASADLYSLGLLMCELLTGRAPETPEISHSLPRTIRTLLDLRSNPPVLPRRFNPAVPHALEAIAARCLAHAPADRYADATALAEDLECFLDRRGLQYASNPSTRERTRNWASRHRKVLLAASLVVGIAGAAGGRPIARLLVPVERSSAFLTAVGEVDASRFRDVIRPLEAIVEDSPDSPLARYYLGIARQGTDLDGASVEFAKALAIPGGVDALVAWGKGHPQVARQLESLGMALLDGNQPGLAGHAFRISLGLDPKLKTARQGAADVHEFLQQYPQSHEILSGLIKEAEERSTPDARHLAVWYRMRARTAVRLGEFLPSDPEAKSTSRSARDHFQSAFNDLERSHTYLGQIDNKGAFTAQDDERAFKAQAVRADALIALGALDAKEGQLAASREHFREARRIIVEKLVPGDDKQKKERLLLTQKLEAREGRGQNLTALAPN